jgi:hypothetical protein
VVVVAESFQILLQLMLAERAAAEHQHLEMELFRLLQEQ